MHKFGYDFLKSDMFPASFISYAQSIEKNKVRFELKTFVNSVEKNKLETQAMLKSVYSSNAIEGIVTSQARLESIVYGNVSPSGHDEEEILGYKKAYQNIIHNYRKTAFTEDLIKRLHSEIMSFSADRSGGEYKIRDNAIIEVDGLGNRKIRFIPTSAADTPLACEQLVLAFMSADQDNGINKLLLIPCVIMDFLCIHPFWDGNGRVSRLLTLYFLLFYGFDVIKYISFDEEINNNKEYYYEALKESSQSWNENKNSYIPFIKFFLYILSSCYGKF